MGLKELLIPQEKKFFDLINEQAAKIQEGVNLLDEMLKDFKGIEQKRAKLKELEHEADMLVHNIYHELNKTFITPIDREDISQLTSRLDDIMDYAYGVANRIHLYEIKEPTKPMKEFSQTLVSLVNQIVIALGKLPAMKNTKELQEACIEINRLENLADEILGNSVSELFREKDVIKIIKLKEIYEAFETATDRCEDVADIITDVVAKNG